MVHQEQLALVVARVVAEPEGLLDDLLRGADGQRRLRGEVLQGRPVPVDGGVVEVGAELPHGVLGVPAHEHLAAEAHDRLVGRAVAVVLEAGPVELHHPPGVLGGPEDVVVEEPVAVVGGLLRDLGGADRAVPHEGGHAVERARGRGETLQGAAEPALPVDHVLPPQPVEQAVVLDRQRDALADVLAEPRIDRAGVAPPHGEVHAAVGQVLQVGVVLRDAHRVGGGDQGGGRGQLQPLGLRRDARQQDGRVPRRHERRVVVLARGEDVQAHLLRLLRDLDGGPDPLVLGGGASRGGVLGDVPDGEDAELHVVLLLRGGVRPDGPPCSFKFELLSSSGARPGLFPPRSA